LAEAAVHPFLRNDALNTFSGWGRWVPLNIKKSDSNTFLMVHSFCFLICLFPLSVLVVTAPWNMRDCASLCARSGYQHGQDTAREEETLVNKIPAVMAKDFRPTTWHCYNDSKIIRLPVSWLHCFSTVYISVVKSRRTAVFGTFRLESNSKTIRLPPCRRQGGEAL
jgi:hypothetical protein